MTDFSPRKGMTASDIEQTVDAILLEASQSEKVAMMSGRGFFAAYRADGGRWGARPYRAGSGCERLGIPPLWFTDGPRGVARGQSTCFPVTMARGASWDVDLERRIGEVMGIEARAQGCTLSGAVCVNLLRHPAWGRAQETYGEDTWHLGAMGAALATGIQRHNVIATVKHFALNSIENSRFKVDVRIDARALHEVYLPHFKHILKSGCASVMSAYNKVNGAYCGENRILLTEILRDQWGFDGFVHSDWVFGVYKPEGATAGLDIENPEPRVFGQALEDAVTDGRIGPDVIDTACRRILKTQYRFAAAADPLPAYTADLVACAAHRALAQEAAEKSAVLLRNTGALPLNPSARIGLFGLLADMENTGDHGSSRVQPPEVITPRAGLAAYLDQADLAVLGDERDPAAAAQAAKKLDAAIIIVGYTREEEGEFIPGDLTLGAEGGGTKRVAIGGDRADLGLPPAQVALVRAVCAANPNSIVVLVAGSAVLMSDWHEAPAAILQTFYAGMGGGHALARLLFGAVSPSGKLPFTIARDAADYPFFDHTADTIEYDLWHGYSRLERCGKAALYPFGFGLSYTKFSFSGLVAEGDLEAIRASVMVRNDGAVTADTVVQLYVGFPGKAVERPIKLLRGFVRVSLAAGESRTVSFGVARDDLRYWDTATADWALEPGIYRILVGDSSDDQDLICATIQI
jgi:beta-glucosidase